MILTLIGQILNQFHHKNSTKRNKFRHKESKCKNKKKKIKDKFKMTFMRFTNFSIKINKKNKNK